MKNIPIFFGFDEQMLMPAGVCITSLLENADKDTFYDIFILHDGKYNFRETMLMRLPENYKNCRITFRTVNDEFADAYEIRGITTATYYKLLAPVAIPEYDKIIYSDVDVIFREDLSHFYNLDLGNHYFAAVDNCSALRPAVQESIRNRLGLDWRQGYYYAGNLVVHSKLLRQDGKINEFRELGRKKYMQQDMDIMNIACNGRFFPLGPSFCLTIPMYDLILDHRTEMAAIYGEEELEHALRSGIVHYNGAKPWNDICLNMDIWWDYYRRSIFYDERFSHDFWNARTKMLDNLSLIKRIKLIARYFQKLGC